MSVYIQVGAGAGDNDSRSNYRDGFTEYVKALDISSIDKIILVEPNPFNIEKLKECWKDYPQARILNIGIATSDKNNSELHFYYATEDAPHYQVCSIELAHVKKHYPNGTIKTFTILCKDLKTVINENVTNTVIDMIALDIEGIDAAILLDTDWTNIPCKKLSFETLHLGNQEQQVKKHLIQAGYIQIGKGLDHNGYDVMYQNTKYG